jgi:transcriptional regulator with XRE-family HTH domain
MVISNETSREEIGKRIERFRAEKGLTQQQVADALYVDRVTISQWENGSRDIKTGNMVSLAEYFGVSCDYLLGRTRTTAPDDFIQEAVQRFGLNETALAVLADMSDAKGRGKKAAENTKRVHETMLLRDLLNDMLTSKEGQVALKTLAQYCYSDVKIDGNAPHVDYVMASRVDDKKMYMESMGITAEGLLEVILSHLCIRLRSFRKALKWKGGSDGEYN